MSRAGAHTIYYIWRGGRTDFAKLRIKNFIHAIFSLFSCAESEKALFPTVFFQNNIPERYAGKHIFRKNKSFATYIQQYGKTFLVYFLDVRRYGCKASGRWASRARDAFLPARFTDFFTMRRAGLRIFGLGAVARVARVSVDHHRARQVEVVKFVESHKGLGLELMVYCQPLSLGFNHALNKCHFFFCKVVFGIKLAVNFRH